MLGAVVAASGFLAILTATYDLESGSLMATGLDDTLALWWRGEIRRPVTELITWARRQRLLPLLGWRAQQLGWELPAAMTEAIRRSRMAVAAQQALTHQQLRTLGEIAQHLAIPVVLVKGAAAAEAYPEPWMRPYGDIDLLIDEVNASPYLKALRDNGYQDVAGTPGTRHEHLPPLMDPNTGGWVEIHTSLAWIQNRSLFTLSSWADRLRPIANSPGLYAPNPMDHTLYLLFHGIVQHDLERSVQVLTDVWFWTEHWDEREWHKMRSLAEATEMLYAVGLGIELTAWFWGENRYREARMLFPSPPPSLIAMAQRTLVGLPSREHLPHIWRRVPDISPRSLLAFVSSMLFGDSAEIHGTTMRGRLSLFGKRTTYLVRNYSLAMWRLLRGDPATRAAWHAQRDLQAWLRQG